MDIPPGLATILGEYEPKNSAMFPGMRGVTERLTRFMAVKTLASSGTKDKSVKLWNLATGEEIRTLFGRSDYVYSVAFSPDGNTLVSGSQDNTIKIWRLR